MDRVTPLDGTDADVLEGGVHREGRPRRPPSRRTLGIIVAVLVAAGATAYGVVTFRPSDQLPSLTAVAAQPTESSGLLRWVPRGQRAGDAGFVREALQTLRSSGMPDRPRTQLHLLYAGDSFVVLEGVARNGRVALASVTGREVLVDQLPRPEPVALTLPAGPNLRVLVPPRASSAPRPAEVWVRNAGVDAAGGFRRYPADATGLTEVFEPTPGGTRFAVLAPGVSGAVRLQGDGLARRGSLTPTLPAVRLASSPWSVEDSPPTRQWLSDAELLAAGLNISGPVGVARLTGGSGFSPGPARPSAMTYHDALYAVTDASGADFVGYVLRVGDRPLCSRVTAVGGRFADLLVLSGRCNLPGESYEVVSVTSRPDVRRGTIEFSGAVGQPAKRFALAPGAEVLLGEPSYHTVTLTAATDQSSATYVVPPG